MATHRVESQPSTVSQCKQAQAPRYVHIGVANRKHARLVSRTQVQQLTASPRKEEQKAAMKLKTLETALELEKEESVTSN